MQKQLQMKQAYWTVHGYLEGHGDLVSRLIMRVTGVTIWAIGVISILTKYP